LVRPAVGRGHPEVLFAGDRREAVVAELDLQRSIFP
jgi:hypothetical protein